MAANLQPISSDGGFNSGGNININNGGNIVTAPEQDLNIIVQDSNGTGGAAGNSISIIAGAADQSDYYTTAGGNVNITGGLGATDDGGGGGVGGSVNISAGLSADPVGNAGNVVVTVGGSIYTFTELDLNVTTDPPASPAPSLNGFGLVSAPIFTNGTGNVTIQANLNPWVFDNTGNLTIPGSSGGFIKTVANASIGIAAVDKGTNNPAQLLSMTDAGAATSIISAYATNATIQTNATGTLKTWSFDDTGVLTVAGNIIMPPGATLKGTGASPAPSISGFDSASFGGNLSAANLTVANLTANATALFGPSASANFTRFPHAQVVISNVAAGIQQNESGNIGLISETTANSANTSVRGVGVYGVGYTSSGASADGVDGEGHVSDTNDTGTATGVRGYSYDAHVGGVNIGVYASALNGATNYALYMKHGNIISDDPQTWTLADNNASALSFNATGKTGILDIVTTNGSEGVTMSGTLSVTGNATVGNISATNLGNIASINLNGNGSQILLGNGTFASVPSSSIIANGNSNVTIATSAGNVVTNVNGALALTVSASGIKVSGGGALQSPGGATAITLNNNGANIPTANITTQLNVTGASGATVTGNVTAGNISTGGALSVTGNAAVTGTLTSTGKIGYASGSTVTQTTNRGNGVTINALAGTIITTSATMVAGQIDTFSVANDQVDPNNDIVLVQIVSPNFGVYNCIAQPSATISTFLNGFYINIQNISGFTTSSDAITIRFMVIKAPNA
jgi:hypothetical protein